MIFYCWQILWQNCFIVKLSYGFIGTCYSEATNFMDYYFCKIKNPKRSDSGLAH